MYKILWLCCCLVACQQSVPTNDTPAPNVSAPAPVVADDDWVSTKTGKKIRRAAQNITIHFDDGWQKSDMDFHLSYCEQMMAGLSDKIDPKVFCPCFLDKIQYYYEPIYFKEAYEDQQQWNQECYQAALR